MKVILIGLIVGLIGYSSAECNAVYATFAEGGESPIIPADVCVNSREDGTLYSSTLACEDGEGILKSWLGIADCKGDATASYAWDMVFNSTDSEEDVKLVCTGKTCPHVVVRDYASNDTKTCQDGDYTESPLVMDGCWQADEDASIKYSCTEESITVQIWRNYNCNGNVALTYNEEEDTCGLVGVCSDEATQFIVYSTITITFLFSLFIQ
mmetsp:Transcript_56717/g.51036  ORF Transcript_56717/g.51036 Transcript_56717/m.51036 type:complete len:210 (-) Transcript_56717:171-800(-)